MQNNSRFNQKEGAMKKAMAMNFLDYCQQLIYLSSVKAGRSHDESLGLVNSSEIFYYNDNYFVAVFSKNIAYAYFIKNGQVYEMKEIPLVLIGYEKK